MGSIIDKFSNLSTPVQAVVLSVIGLLFFGICYFFLFGNREKVDDEVSSTVMLEMQDPTVDDRKHRSRIDQYERSAIAATKSHWDDLEQSVGGGLKVKGKTSDIDSMSVNEKSKAPNVVDGTYLDPAEYSELERYQISTGAISKSEVDANHAVIRARAEVRKARDSAAKSPVITQAQADSLYFARMERVMDMVSSQFAGSETSKESASVTSNEPPQPQGPRHIDIGEAVLPNTPVSDGIISSLSTTGRSGMVYTDGEVVVRPARATFLKEERITSGQRVIMRLLEDLVLSDGTVIPANTHITGQCSVGGRFTIKVSSIRYNGHMFRTDLSVYDNDGTEGIYCPLIEKKKGAGAGARIAGQAVSGLASTVSTLFTGNPLLGRVAQSGMRELSQIRGKDGSVSIGVVPGYEFYVFENVKR